MVEKWKQVPGYEGKYDVSDLGRVRSNGRNIRNSRSSFREIPSQIIKPFQRKGGYATIRLADAGRKTTHYIHRLVARAFLGEGEARQEVLHGNGDKADNRVNNLSWGSRFDNMADRARLSESARGEAHGRSKITELQARQIKSDGRYQRIIAAEYGVSRRLVGMIKAGKVWCHL